MPQEKITAVISLKEYEDNRYLFMATKKGMVKKTKIRKYENIRKSGLAAISLKEEDELIEVKTTNNHKDIFLVTKDGMCIRFNERDVRSTGRTSMGVIGMNLSPDDEVVAMQIDSQGKYMLIVSENGLGKRTDMEEFTCQHRGGKGVKCYKILEKTGNVVGAKAVDEENEVMLITNEGIIIRLAVSGISKLGRITSGVKLMDIDTDKDIRVASVAKVKESGNAANEEEVLKKLEEELAAENIPDEGDGEEDGEILEEGSTPKENATLQDGVENSTGEDLSDLDELVHRALKDMEETEENGKEEE